MLNLNFEVDKGLAYIKPEIKENGWLDCKWRSPSRSGIAYLFELRRVAVISYPTVFIAVVTLIIIGISRLIWHDTVQGLIDLLFSLVMTGIILYHRKTKFRNYLVLHLGITVYGMFCLYLFFFNEIVRAPYLWSYTFPQIVFPLTGSRRGTIVVTMFLIPISLLLILGPALSFMTSYPQDFAFSFTGLGREVSPLG